MAFFRGGDKKSGPSYFGCFKIEDVHRYQN